MGTLFKRADAGGKTGVWYAEYTDASGKRIKKSTGTREKRAAEDILRQYETEAAKIRAGVMDPHAERMREQQLRPISEHLAEYLTSLKASGCSEIHYDRTEKRIKKILAFAAWKTFRDCTAEKLESFAATLVEADSSPATIGHYLQAVKGFASWAHRTKRIPADPFWTIRKPNPESDRRLQRRMILPEEWPHLIRATQDISFGMDGEARRLLYEFAIQTALRSNEIRSCTVGRVDFSKPAVSVDASSTKNKQTAWMHLTREFATRLRRYCDDRSPSDKLFDLCNPTNMARMIKADMLAARKAWIEELEDEEGQKQRSQTDFLAIENRAGETLDFHSLRHTCGAWLAMKGVHPKTIQSIMRHSTITLTLDTYGHLMPGAEPEAIAKLTDLLTVVVDLVVPFGRTEANSGGQRRDCHDTSTTTSPSKTQGKSTKHRKTGS